MKNTMKLALEALENVEHVSGSTDWFDDCVAAALALKEALTKQEQRSVSEQLGEPIAWMRSEGVGSPIVTEELCQKYPEYRLFFTVPLYTTPPQSEAQRAQLLESPM